MSLAIQNARFAWVRLLNLQLRSGSKDFLVSFLSTKVFLLGPIPVAKLIKCVGNKKSKVFTTPGYKLNQGVVHALVLQLIAAGILSIYVANETKEGNNRLLLNDFVVNWVTIIDSGDTSTLAHTNESLWGPFNCISSFSNMLQYSTSQAKSLTVSSSS
jgi:hypothetical protein